jgi:hypothetical protein
MSRQVMFESGITHEIQLHTMNKGIGIYCDVHENSLFSTRNFPYWFRARERERESHVEAERTDINLILCVRVIQMPSPWFYFLSLSLSPHLILYIIQDGIFSAALFIIMIGVVLGI